MGMGRAASAVMNKRRETQRSGGGEGMALKLYLNQRSNTSKA